MDTAVKKLPDAYECSVMNRYGELLDDDGDPFDMIGQMQTLIEEKKKEEEKKKKKKKAKQGKPGQKESQGDRCLPEPAPGTISTTRRHQFTHATCTHVLAFPGSCECF